MANWRQKNLSLKLKESVKKFQEQYNQIHKTHDDPNFWGLFNSNINIIIRYSLISRLLVFEETPMAEYY